MPRRTNTFQQVVAIVHRHMSQGQGAIIEESAMVEPVGGGTPREVDVLITSEVAGHPVRVAVEASRGSRPSTVEWVEQMIGKHADLPTDKLVLCSGRGFTSGALGKATAHNVVAISEGEANLEDRVLGGLKTLWPRTISIVPREAILHVRRRDGSTAEVTTSGDMPVVYENGSPTGTDVTQMLRWLMWPRAEQLQRGAAHFPDIHEDVEVGMSMGWNGPITARVRDQWRVLCVTVGDEPCPIVQLEMRGTISAKFSRSDLAHKRLGQVSVASAGVELFGSPGILVASGTPGQEAVTVRLPDAPDNLVPLVVDLFGNDRSNKAVPE